MRMSVGCTLQTRAEKKKKLRFILFFDVFTSLNTTNKNNYHHTIFQAILIILLIKRTNHLKCKLLKLEDFNFFKTTFLYHHIEFYLFIFFF